MAENSPTSATGESEIPEAEELLAWFARAGYIRRYNPERREIDGKSYKKGFEVRFTLESRKAVQTVKRLLLKAEIKPGKPYPKHSRIILPAYGKSAMQWFMDRLPDGRERAKLGFAPNGKRISTRSKTSRRG